MGSDPQPPYANGWIGTADSMILGFDSQDGTFGGKRAVLLESSSSNTTSAASSSARQAASAPTPEVECAHRPSGAPSGRSTLPLATRREASRKISSLAVTPQGPWLRAIRCSRIGYPFKDAPAARGCPASPAPCCAEMGLMQLRQKPGGTMWGL